MEAEVTVLPIVDVSDCLLALEAIYLFRVVPVRK